MIVAVIAAAAGTAVVMNLRDGGRSVPPPSPTASGTVVLSQSALKLMLADRFDPLFFCDPDVFPVGSEDAERRNARAWWNSTDHSGEEVLAILAHHGMRAPSTDAEIVRVYREHKRLLVITLERSGDGFHFRLRRGTESSAEEITGTVSSTGVIREARRRRVESSCPICLAGATMIDTPRGPVPASRVRPGTIVWSTDGGGRRIAVPVVRVTSRQAASVLLVRIRTEDGRELVAAAAHPMADGRALGLLRPGDAVAGSVVRTREIVANPSGLTVDLLPAGPTGRYWADGFPLGSTVTSS